MSSARGFYNQKLYYAALLLKALAGALKQSDTRPEVLLEAYGQAIQGHLQDAYGWLLLELVTIEVLPAGPPESLAELLAAYPQPEPLRGELVEIQQLEQDAGSWLSSLLAAPHHSVGQLRQQSAGLLASSEADSPWAQPGLENWYQALQQLGDRMGDSLDEW